MYSSGSIIGVIFLNYETNRLQKKAIFYLKLVKELYQEYDTFTVIFHKTLLQILVNSFNGTLSKWSDIGLCLTNKQTFFKPQLLNKTNSKALELLMQNLIEYILKVLNKNFLYSLSLYNQELLKLFLNAGISKTRFQLTIVSLKRNPYAHRCKIPLKNRPGWAFIVLEVVVFLFYISHNSFFDN
ncbi:hypothetical protein BpHYR1_037370 [Brachionus plicatilis]|uniref:Uncharacterized protein n=1 Tax=Brachionus plicatilis TaxID=10195 RepID=A0A3M7S4Y4_BRAPC|nr:hypothetical protein BpHYR1_037370 [Brachionus plicatilis]